MALQTGPIVYDDEGQLLLDKVKLVDGASFVKLINQVAAIPPDQDNDALDGYILGSLWIDIFMETVYICVDNTPGQAEWIRVDTSEGDAPSNAEYVTLATNAQLGNERVLTAGTGIQITDNGPASTVVVDTTITQYTDELAQDAVGAIVADTDSIALDYDDDIPSITATLKDTTVTPGTYGDVALIPVFTVDAQGRLTGVLEVTPELTSANIDDFVEAAQDAVGAALVSTTSVNLTYNDIDNEITADVNPNTSVQQVEVAKNSGVVIATRKQLNFTEGANVQIDITDDNVNDQVDIAVSSTPPNTGVEVAFDFGDATPKPIYTIAADKLIYSARIGITVPFNGVNSSLSLGDSGNPQRLLQTSEVDPYTTGIYETSPLYKYGSPTQIELAINQGIGCTQGSGIVVIVFQQ